MVIQLQTPLRKPAMFNNKLKICLKEGRHGTFWSMRFSSGLNPRLGYTDGAGAPLTHTPAAQPETLLYLQQHKQHLQLTTSHAFTSFRGMPARSQVFC